MLTQRVAFFRHIRIGIFVICHISIGTPTYKPSGSKIYAQIYISYEAGEREIDIVDGKQNIARSTGNAQVRVRIFLNVSRKENRKLKSISLAHEIK